MPDLIDNDELDFLMKKLNYSKTELMELIRQEREKYPHINTDLHAVYMIAKDKNLQFSFGNRDEIVGVTHADPDLDVDVSKFIE